MHKAGFVNIIGNPNVGKSTLMNQLTGEKLSIITSKAQTTRHRIMGIVSGDDFQIVYSDTPGILQPKYKLQESMLKYVESALSDADIFLFVTDSVDSKNVNIEYVERLKQMETPIIVVINKIDTIDQEAATVLIDQWLKLIPQAEIAPISALHKFNIPKVFDLIISKLPESPAYFEKEKLTDKPMRFFVSEIIREKILVHFRQEIPYATQVVVESFKEFPQITKISATIYVERESQKPIIIGNKGLAIKRIGIEARKDIEKFVDAKVYLELFVKVNKDWRSNPSKLKGFGFDV
ncbi:MAG: GTPase Era [Bacteroidales bacterium]|nr:GTPase Era [Bacteroidales bacterium]